MPYTNDKQLKAAKEALVELLQSDGVELSSYHVVLEQDYAGLHIDVRLDIVGMVKAPQAQPVLRLPVGRWNEG